MAKTISNKYLFAVIIILLTLEVCTVFFYRKTVHSEDSPVFSETSELAAKNREIATLKQKIESLSSANSASAPLACPTAVACQKQLASASNKAIEAYSDSALQYAASARVAAISKYINLSEQQKIELKSKYINEISGNHSANDVELDDIVGKENADFYRERRQQAFEQIQSEATEKEVLFIARLMNLNRAEEQQLRSIYLNIESQFANKDRSSKYSMQEIVDEEKAKEIQLREKIATTFNPNQYKAFLDYQSKQQSMGMWHGGE